MTPLVIDVDDQAVARLRQRAEREGLEVAELAGRLLAEATDQDPFESVGSFHSDVVGAADVEGVLGRPHRVRSFDLPPDARARLDAEAARRKITVDELIADLAAQLPAERSPERRHRLGFVGVGSSGRTEPFDIQRVREDLAAKKLADGI